MTESLVEPGVSGEKLVPLGSAEIENLIDFWRQRLPNFSPIITHGLDYVGLLSEAAESQFLTDIDIPHDIRSLIAGATEVLSQIPDAECDRYNKWLQVHPKEIIIIIDGVTYPVTEVAVMNHDIFPLINGEVMTTKLDAYWLRGEDDENEA